MLLTLIAFFAVLGLLVLAHELGHFVVARKFGVKVEEFGFGLPPRLFGIQVAAEKKLEKLAGAEELEVNISEYQATEDTAVIKETITEKLKDFNQISPVKKWRFIWGRKEPTTKDGEKVPLFGTVYSLNWVPLGGFVKIKGEQGEAPQDADSFTRKTVWQRIVIISAGVVMNIILAAVLFSIGLTLGSPQFIDEQNLPKSAQIRDKKIMIIKVLADSPAQQAGLEMGDAIISVDGKSFDKIEDFQEYAGKIAGESATLVIDRSGQKFSKEITPKVLAETNKGGFGIALVQTAIVSYPWYVAWWYGIGQTLQMVWAVIVGFYLVIKNLIVSQKLIADVYGPVGIATLVGDAAHLGFLYLLQFTATLSIIIAVINFLPFPALDGGRVLFLIIEGVRRKAVNQRIEALIHNLGFALLMVLVIIVTFRDISRLSSGVFVNFFRSLTGL